MNSKTLTTVFTLTFAVLVAGCGDNKKKDEQSSVQDEATTETQSQNEEDTTAIESSEVILDEVPTGTYESATVPNDAEESITDSDAIEEETEIEG